MSTPGSPNPQPQGVVPPYDKDESNPQENPISKNTGKDHPETSADTYGSSTGNPGRVVSDEEKGGVGDADMNPKPVMGVGEHLSTAGEDQGGGVGQARQDSGQEGHKGASARPAGSHGDDTSISTSADDTGIGQSGDQGG